jgi:hypothetical protein
VTTNNFVEFFCLKFPSYDANEKLLSKWTDSFAEFVIANIMQSSEKNCFLENKIKTEEYIYRKTKKGRKKTTQNLKN